MSGLKKKQLVLFLSILTSTFVLLDNLEKQKGKQKLRVGLILNIQLYKSVNPIRKFYQSTMKRVGWVLNEISILKLTVKASQISGGIEREKVHLVGGALNVTIPKVIGTIKKSFDSSTRIAKSMMDEQVIGL